MQATFHSAGLLCNWDRVILACIHCPPSLLCYWWHRHIHKLHDNVATRSRHRDIPGADTPERTAPSPRNSPRTNTHGPADGAGPVPIFRTYMLDDGNTVFNSWSIALISTHQTGYCHLMFLNQAFRVLKVRDVPNYTRWLAAESWQVMEIVARYDLRYVSQGEQVHEKDSCWLAWRCNS